MLELITDRTQSDIANKTKKGYYNAEDLNRVSSAMEYLVSELLKYGYNTPGYEPVIAHPPIYDENTLLLLHGESVNDSSIYEVPLTNNGVQVSVEKSKFGGKSLYFNGNAYLTINKVFSFETNDFTIDFWWYQQTAGTYVIFSGNGYGSFFFGFTNSGNQFFVGRQQVSFDLTFNSTPEVNVWTHWALVKHSGMLSLYKNGNLVRSSTNNISYSTLSNLTNFGYDGSSSFSFGYIDEFRVSNVARWTSNFTPPNAPYTNTVDSETEEPVKDKYTWYEDDIPTKPQMEQYRNNVAAIRAVLEVLDTTPETPDSMEQLTYQKANDLEKILLDVEDTIVRMSSSVNLGWTLGIADIGLYGGV